MPKRTNEYRVRSIRQKQKKGLIDEAQKEKWELVFDNVGLIYDILSVYESHDRAFEFQDLLTTAMICFFDLIDGYKYKVNGKRIKFTTYIRRFLRGKILNFLTRKTYGSPKKKTHPIEMIEDEEEGEQGEGLLAGKNRIEGLQEMEESARERKVSKLLSSLIPHQKDIVIFKHLLEHTYQETGDHFGITKEASKQTGKRGITNIRKGIIGDWDKYRNAIKYRDKLFKLFGPEDIEQEKTIKKILKQNKQKGREEYNKWVNAMPEKKRNAYCEIRSLNSLIQEYIKDIRKKIRDAWEDTGI